MSKNFSSFENLSTLFTSIGNKFKEIFSASEDLLRDTVGWTGKNLILFPPYTSGSNVSVNNVTFVVNSDGSITVSTTNAGASAQTIFTLVAQTTIGQREIFLDAEDIILTGGISENIWMNFNRPDAGGGNHPDTGNGAVMKFTNAEDIYNVALVINSGTIITTPITVYPMVRKASVDNSTYEPFHTSVKQMFKNVRKEQAILGAKNLLENKAVTVTKSDVVYTVNPDKSISLSGTSTAANSIDLNYYTGAELKAMGDKLILSGGVSSLIYVAVRDESWNLPAKSEGGDAILNTSNLVDATTYIVCLAIANGQNTDGKTSYPMLRLASDPDDTYAPYAMTNKELTDAKQDKLTAGTNITIQDNVISASGGSSYDLYPEPSSSLTEATAVAAVKAHVAADGGENDELPSLYVMANWCNAMVKRYLIQGTAGSSTPIGTTGVGTWSDDASDQTGWIYIPELVGIGSDNTKDFKIGYDPLLFGGTVTLGGFVIDDTTGKMCIKFGNTISTSATHTGLVTVDILTSRNNVSAVS